MNIMLSLIPCVWITSTCCGINYQWYCGIRFIKKLLQICNQMQRNTTKFIDNSDRNDSYERRDIVILSVNKLPDVKQSEMQYNTTYWYCIEELSWVSDHNSRSRVRTVTDLFWFGVLQVYIPASCALNSFNPIQPSRGSNWNSRWGELA